MRRVLVLALGLAVALAGCARIQPVQRDRVAVGGGLSVLGSAVWNRFSAGVLGADAAWTQDGLPLDRVLFFVAHGDGAPLFRHGRERRSLEFHAGMSATEIADLWASELALAGNGAVSTGAPRPEWFAGLRGFRFDYSYASPTGLVFDGFAAGVVTAKGLYLIAFAGTRAHHFPAYRAAADQLIGSAEIAAE
jgi:hypothetical protein